MGSPPMNPDVYADPAITEIDGRLVVTWPDGRRLWCAATPELVEDWAATVNAARDERDRYAAALKRIAGGSGAAGHLYRSIAREALGPAREETT